MQAIEKKPQALFFFSVSFWVFVLNIGQEMDSCVGAYFFVTNHNVWMHVQELQKCPGASFCHSNDDSLGQSSELLCSEKQKECSFQYKLTSEAPWYKQSQYM